MPSMAYSTAGWPPNGSPLTGCRVYRCRRIQDQDSDSRGGNAGRFPSPSPRLPRVGPPLPFKYGKLNPSPPLASRKDRFHNIEFLIFKA